MIKLCYYLEFSFFLYLLLLLENLEFSLITFLDLKSQRSCTVSLHRSLSISIFVTAKLDFLKIVFYLFSSRKYFIFYFIKKLPKNNESWLFFSTWSPYFMKYENIWLVLRDFLLKLNYLFPPANTKTLVEISSNPR